MNQIKINESTYMVDEKLESFDLKKMTSSNIDVYGANEFGQAVFMFIGSTSCFLYEDLTPEQVEELNNCESIGKFHAALRKTTKGRMIGNDMIVLVPIGKALLKETVIGTKNIVYGKKHDEVTVLSFNTAGDVAIVEREGVKFSVLKSNLLISKNK